MSDVRNYVGDVAIMWTTPETTWKMSELGGLILSQRGPVHVITRISSLYFVCTVCEMRSGENTDIDFYIIRWDKLKKRENHHIANTRF